MDNVAIALAATGAGLLLGTLAWRWALALTDPVGRLPSRASASLSCAFGCGVLALRYGASLELLELAGLCLVLVTLSLTDLAALVIPNACIAGAVTIRLGYLALLAMAGHSAVPALVVRSLVGALAALVPLTALTLLMDRALGAESLGGGDLKLLAVAGLYVGWRQLPPLLVVACLLGIAIAALLPRREDGGLAPFPFGPAISAALWLTLLAGDVVDSWMLAWVF